MYKPTPKEACKEIHVATYKLCGIATMMQRGNALNENSVDNVGLLLEGIVSELLEALEVLSPAVGFADDWYETFSRNGGNSRPGSKINCLPQGQF